MGIDQTLFKWLYAVAESSGFMRFWFAFFAEYIVYAAIIYLIVQIFLIKGTLKRWYFFSLAALSSIISLGIVTQMIHVLFSRTRPFVALDLQPFVQPFTVASFPSGHMAIFVPVLLTLWYIKPHYRWWLLSTGLMVGISRIAVGLHWPMDILGGIAIGIGSFYIVRFFLKERYESGIKTT